MNGIKEKRPLVSVIMNCFNGEEFLKYSLESLLAQTYENWELIFWDNQSSDLSSTIVKSFSDKRIKYFLAPNHTNLGKARNLAFTKAKGEWIAFFDCDDLWAKEKLMLQVNRSLIGDGVKLIYCKTEYFSSNNRLFTDINRSILPEGHIFHLLAKNNFISLSSALVYAEEFRLVNGIEERFHQAEDYDLFIKICFRSKVGVVKEPLVKCRLHGHNLSSKQKDLAYIESIEILEHYLPDKRALLGLREWSSFYLAFCMKRFKHEPKAIKLFLSYGSIWTLFRKSMDLLVKKYKNFKP